MGGRIQLGTPMACFSFNRLKKKLVLQAVGFPEARTGSEEALAWPWEGTGHRGPAQFFSHQ